MGLLGGGLTIGASVVDEIRDPSEIRDKRNRRRRWAMSVL